MSDDKSSWKQIQQLLSSPAITPIAKHRRQSIFFKRLAWISAVVAFLGLCLAGVLFLHSHSRTIAPYAQAPKTHISFFSDGQLSSTWFNQHFPELDQKGLLSIDIDAVQTSLLRDSQIKSVSVERHFPSTLKITVSERRPIGRVKVRQKGQLKIYYLDPDGQFYTSSSYIPPVNLPFITSADLVSAPDGLMPLPGAEKLAELIDGLKNQYPHLGAELTYMDLKSWIFPVTEQTCVCLKLRGNTTLRFAGENISVQLNRLSEVLRLIKDEHGSLKNKTIDLTYPDRVAIVES